MSERRSLREILASGGEMRSGLVERPTKPTLHVDVGMRAIRVPDPMADEPPHRTVIGELPFFAVRIGGGGYDSGAED